MKIGKMQLAVNVAPVADSHDEDHQFVALEIVNDAVISDADAIGVFRAN